MLRPICGLKKIPPHSRVYISSICLPRRAASSTGRSAQCTGAEKHDRVGLVFSDSFKGMEELLVRGPTTDPPSTRGAGSVFPDINSLFRDVDASNARRETTSPSFFSTSGTMQRTRAEGNSCGNTGDGSKQHNSLSHPNIQPKTSSSDSRAAVDNNTNPRTTSTSSDTQRYAYAFDFWKNRNAALLQIEVDVQEMTTKAHYLREVQEENLKNTMRSTSRLFLFVAVPFVMLISGILFNESELYSAELKHLRLIDYDAWLEAHGNNGNQKGGFPGGKGGASGGNAGFGRYKQDSYNTFDEKSKQQ